jgi:hypothetical protein
MEYTITEIREVGEFNSKRGLMYQFYCVVTGQDGTEVDARIDAKSSNRWKTGAVVEIEDKGYEPWERNGVVYTVVTANVPERLRQNGGGGQSRSFGSNGRQQQGNGAQRRGLPGSNGGQQRNEGQNQGRAQGASKAQPSAAAPALPFEGAAALYGRLTVVVPSEHSRAVLFQAILNGRVTAPASDFHDNEPDDLPEEDQFDGVEGD